MDRQSSRDVRNHSFPQNWLAFLPRFCEFFFAKFKKFSRTTYLRTLRRFGQRFLRRFLKGFFGSFRCLKITPAWALAQPLWQRNWKGPFFGRILCQGGVLAGTIHSKSQEKHPEKPAKSAFLREQNLKKCPISALVRNLDDFFSKLGRPWDPGGGGSG